MTASTVVHGEHRELADWLQRRAELGLDTRDEVWAGVLHVVPHASGQHAMVAAQFLLALAPYARRAGLRALTEFNLGEPDDYRIPDAGWVQQADLSARATYLATAMVVVEVMSAGEDHTAKLAFYTARGVREVILAWPHERAVLVYDTRSGSMVAVSTAFAGVTVEDIRALIDWP